MALGPLLQPELIVTGGLGRRVHAQATAPPPRLRTLRLLHAKEKNLRVDAVDLFVNHMFYKSCMHYLKTSLSNVNVPFKNSHSPLQIAFPFSSFHRSWYRAVFVTRALTVDRKQSCGFFRRDVRVLHDRQVACSKSENTGILARDTSCNQVDCESSESCTIPKTRSTRA